MTIVKTKKLALAAYIKMTTQLIKKENGYYYFECNASIDELEIAYYNSCCSRHDAELINLRKLR